MSRVYKHVVFLLVRKRAYGAYSDRELAAGYTYEGPIPFTPGTSILQVRYEWVRDAQPIIEAAQRECVERREELTRAED